eukprot:5793704-Pleurochrysis_carterae.AAC.1
MASKRGGSRHLGQKLAVVCPSRLSTSLALLTFKAWLCRCCSSTRTARTWACLHVCVSLCVRVFVPCAVTAARRGRCVHAREDLPQRPFVLFHRDSRPLGCVGERCAHGGGGALALGGLAHAPR